METCLETYEVQKARIPSIFAPLLEKHVRAVRTKINKGLMDICWNSLIQGKYFKGISEALDNLKRIIDEVIDMKEQRIDALLAKIANHELIILPPEKSIKVNEFVDFIKQQTVPGASLLEKYSQSIEDAIHNLIAVFVKYEGGEEVPADFSIDCRYKIPEVNNAKSEVSVEDGDLKQKETNFELNCREVIHYFKNRCLEKITFCLKQSLEVIKKRVMYSKNAKDSGTVPLFLIDINLAIPHVTYAPSLDELQQVLNKAARYIVETGKSITAWGQHRIEEVEVEDENGEKKLIVQDVPADQFLNWYPVIQVLSLMSIY